MSFRRRIKSDITLRKLRVSSEPSHTSDWKFLRCLPQPVRRRPCITSYEPWPSPSVQARSFPGRWAWDGWTISQMGLSWCQRESIEEVRRSTTVVSNLRIDPSPQQPRTQLSWWLRGPGGSTQCLAIRLQPTNNKLNNTWYYVRSFVMRRLMKQAIVDISSKYSELVGVLRFTCGCNFKRVG